MPTPKEFLWIALASIVVAIVVNRTPLADYVSGQKKIAGVL